MTDAQLKLIRNRQLELDVWSLYEGSLEELTHGQLVQGYWLIPFELWKHIKQSAIATKSNFAILLNPDTDPDELLEVMSDGITQQMIDMIAIDFPIYTDGRGYSLAQILRNEADWGGELRAVGDVFMDTIHYQARCGFNSFLIKDGHDPKYAMQAFDTFSAHYQKSYAGINR